MKMIKFPFANKNKHRWYEDPYYLEVPPEKNELRVGKVCINEFHHRWGLMLRRTPFNMRIVLSAITPPAVIIAEHIAILLNSESNEETHE